MSKNVMNGPAEFEMKVWVINDETGQQGQAVVGLGAFEYPTKEKVKDKIDRLFIDNEELKGFRLMTKAESFSAFCIENYGETFALTGGDNWDEI